MPYRTLDVNLYFIAASSIHSCIPAHARPRTSRSALALLGSLGSTLGVIPDMRASGLSVTARAASQRCANIFSRLFAARATQFVALDGHCARHMLRQSGIVSCALLIGLAPRFIINDSGPALRRL